MDQLVVLMMDGLEADLVEDPSSMNLMQEHHGRYRVPEEYYHIRERIPYTPTVWSSFITGMKPSQHGIREWWVRDDPVWLNALRQVTPEPIKQVLRPIRKRIVRPKAKLAHLNKPTIFDAVKPSVALFIPCYNEPTDPHLRLNEALRRGVDEYVKEIWRLHEWREVKLFQALKRRKWRLFACWLDLVDLLGHVCWYKRKNELKHAYQRFDLIAKEVRKQAENLLIVSDHGMQGSGDGVTGTHSDHAFWSSSFPLGFEPKDPTDFYPAIRRWLG